jgi:MFS family permease
LSFSDHQTIQHQIFRIRFTELNEIFAVMSLRSFVTSMIGIFVPIYLYTIGYSLSDIFLLHIIMFAVEFVFEYLAALIISRFGPKHAIALSMIPFITYFWMLSTITTFAWPMWLLGALVGISMAFYWQGYHYDFSRSKSKTSVTKDVSRLYILLAILGAIAPFFGGLIATNFGFNALYTVVLLLLLVVFLPLIWFKEKHIKRNFKPSRIEISKISRDILSYGGAGIEASIAITIWPLFVFAIVGTTQNVGFVTSIALILSIAVTYLVGKKVTNRNRHGFIKAGGLMDSLVYVLVMFVETFSQILSLNFIRSLISSLRSAPFTSEYYLHADEESRLEYIYVMESSIDLFRLLMFFVLYLVSLYLSDTHVLFVGLAFGAIGSLMTAAMPRAKCELPFAPIDKQIKLISKLRPKNATD